MSDGPQNGPPASSRRFLQHIVDGAFDRMHLLEPRRPSLFERPTLDVADAEEQAADSLGEEEAIRLSVPAGDVAEWTARGPELPGSFDRDHHRWCSDDDRSIEPVQRATIHRARAMTDRAVQPAEPTPQSPSERLQGVRDARPVPALLPATIDMHVEGDRPPRAAGVPAHDTSDVSIARVPEFGILSTPPIDVDGLHADRQPRRPDRRDSSAPEDIGLVNRDGRQPLHAAAAAAAAPGPVVNVTIGRIEVRVAPAQPSRPRQPFEPPKPMSLDQYLRKRGGQR
jgi:hypothetical protein